MRLIWYIIVIFSISWIYPSFAEEERCSGNDKSPDYNADFEIGACTSLIRSGDYSGSDLAIYFNRRGIAYYFVGEYEQALDDYSFAINLAPELASAYFNRALARHDVGFYKEAIEDYTSVLEISPEDTVVLYRRGVAFLESGEINAAIRDFDKAIELQPEYLAAYVSRGSAKRRAGDALAAVADYSTALEIDAQNLPALTNRAAAHAALGDHQSAIADYNRAIDLSPYPVSLHMQRGIAHDAVGDSESARSDYRTAFEIADDANDFNNVAYLFLGSGETTLALEAAKAAVARAPDTGLYQDTLGDMLCRSGHSEEAREAFALAIALDPSIAQIKQKQMKAEGFYAGDVDASFGQDSFDKLGDWVDAFCPGL